MEGIENGKPAGERAKPRRIMGALEYLSLYLGDSFFATSKIKET
jgi:hypothetical protein